MQTHSVAFTVPHVAYYALAFVVQTQAQNSVPTAVEVVRASELTRAVDNGEEHILISQHLYDVPFGDNPALLELKMSTKSIQGRCLDPPAVIPEGYRAGQCLVETPQQLVATAGRQSQLLLSHLYVRRTAGQEPGFDDGVGFQTLILAEAGSTLWMTNVTLSGCGQKAGGPGAREGVTPGGHIQPGGGCSLRGRGLHTIAARVLMADCELRGFVATRGAAWLAADDREGTGGSANVGAAAAIRTSFSANAGDAEGAAVFVLRRHLISFEDHDIPNAFRSPHTVIDVVDRPRQPSGTPVPVPVPSVSPQDSPVPAPVAVQLAARPDDVQVGTGASVPDPAAAAASAVVPVAEAPDTADSAASAAATSRRRLLLRQADSTRRGGDRVRGLTAAGVEPCQRCHGGCDEGGGTQYAAGGPLRPCFHSHALRVAGEAHRATGSHGAGGLAPADLRVRGERGRGLLDLLDDPVVPAVAVEVVTTASDGQPGSQVFASPPLPVQLAGLGEARTARAVGQSGGVTADDAAWARGLTTPTLTDEEYLQRALEAQAAMDGVPIPRPPGGSDGMSAGAIAGCAVAGAAVLGMLAVLLWWLRRRRRAQRKALDLDARKNSSNASNGGVQGQLLPGGGLAPSAPLHAKSPDTSVDAADAFDSIAHAEPTQQGSSASTARTGPSATAFPGSPRTDWSSTGTPMHGSALLNGGGTSHSVLDRSGGAEVPGHHCAWSDASGSTSAYCGTATTLRVVQEGMRWSDASGAGSTVPMHGLHAHADASGAGTGVGMDASASASAVVSALGWSAGSAWSRGDASAGTGVTPQDISGGTVMSSLSFGDTTEMRTFIDATRGTVLPRRELEVLSHTLDLLAARGTLFLDRFVLHSAAQRFHGGQGIVQFAREESTGQECAVKFFTHRGAFERERELYHAPALRGQMPAVRHLEANERAALLMAPGWPFPPCIVVEKGESLDAWATHVRPSFIVIWQVLADLLQRLSAMHACGWVHRDLKPGNVLWRPHEHQWTLIDFGCAAETGSDAPLMLSLAYAAPEVVNAFCRGDTTVRATEALDIWALGVMAFELLTKTTVFPAFTPKDHVYRVAAGGGDSGDSGGSGGDDGSDGSDEGTAPPRYPWEGSSPSAAGARACLGRLESSIMRCVERAPEARPSAAEVLREWDAWLNESRDLFRQPGATDAPVAQTTAVGGRLGSAQSSLGSHDGDGSNGGRHYGGGGRTFPPGRADLPVLLEASLPPHAAHSGTGEAVAGAGPVVSEGLKAAMEGGGGGVRGNRADVDAVVTVHVKGTQSAAVQMAALAPVGHVEMLEAAQ
eukprot:jgi/Ulvmu1/12457/UM009_0109.1